MPPARLPSNVPSAPDAVADEAAGKGEIRMGATGQTEKKEKAIQKFYKRMNMKRRATLTGVVCLRSPGAKRRIMVT